MLLPILRKTLEKFQMLSPGDHLIAGVSGGADSMAMLHGLLALKETLRLSITVLHVNHRLRGADGDADAAFVAAHCAALSLPFIHKSADVRTYAKQQGLSLEEAGRHLRYQYFEAARIAENAQKIAVAHNLNDNAETVLMHVCRGTGLSGLCGIPPVRGCVIRPLLETPRAVIESFLAKQGIPYRTDATNFENIYLRNRVRQAIMPVIQAQLGTATPTIITQATSVLREEDAFLEQLAGQAFVSCLLTALPDEKTMLPTTLPNENPQPLPAAHDEKKLPPIPPRNESQAPQAVRLSVEKLQTVPQALQKRVIRIALRKICGFALRDIAQTHIQQIIDLLGGTTGRQTVLPYGIRAYREYDVLHLYHANAAPAQTANADAFCYTLPLEQPLRLAVTHQYIFATRSGNLPLNNPADICTKIFNYDKINGILQIRTRRPGDRIYFSGVGVKKLQDYFTDCKIPRSHRDTIPLLADDTQILWIMDGRNRTNDRYTYPGDADSTSPARLTVSLYRLADPIPDDDATCTDDPAHTPPIRETQCGK